MRDNKISGSRRASARARAGRGHAAPARLLYKVEIGGRGGGGGVGSPVWADNGVLPLPSLTLFQPTDVNSVGLLREQVDDVWHRDAHC